MWKACNKISNEDIMELCSTRNMYREQNAIKGATLRMGQRRFDTRCNTLAVPWQITRSSPGRAEWRVRMGALSRQWGKIRICSSEQGWHTQGAQSRLMSLKTGSSLSRDQAWTSSQRALINLLTLKWLVEKSKWVFKYCILYYECLVSFKIWPKHDTAILEIPSIQSEK